MITTVPIIVQADWATRIELAPSIKYTERILPKVLETQQNELRPAVGKEFYLELVQVIENGGTVPGALTTLTQAAYDTLSPYLKDIVIYYTYAAYLMDSHTQNTRYGAVQKSNPHSQSLSKEDKGRLIRYYRGIAGNYVGDLEDILKDNSTDYPTWTQNQPKPDESRKQATRMTGIGGVYGNMEATGLC